MSQRRITQHKRFVPYGTHPNSAFSGTSFMLETLAEIRRNVGGYGHALEVGVILFGSPWQELDEGGASWGGHRS